MLKMISYCVRLLFLSVVILVLGNWLRWDGKTLSDQVKVGMSHAEESPVYTSIRDWAKRLTTDAQKGMKNKVKSGLKTETSSPTEKEEISSTERQKLRALIRELNSSHKED